MILSFLLWILCFWGFFTGHLHLQADAVSYADHIRFYIGNLSRGVFPLWDPTWFNGAPNDFFLRRIGEVNPLLILMVPLKWLGISLDASYLMFMAGYYFLAAWAMYLITRLLLNDRFMALMAFALFLFSSWGSEVFYNYIIIIFVPIVWFFYFLLRFGRVPRKAPALGMCFCVGLIVTTYIPFFFLIIFAIFVLLYALFYGRRLLVFLGRTWGFILQHKAFTVLCVAFVLIACAPALLFYKESKNGEFVLPDRHAGAAASSAVAVSLQNVANGDIISHGYFDRLFDDHKDIDMGDIYVPYVFFLLLLCTVAARVNKLVFFLLFNILALSLITVTSAAGLHRFLYEHVFVFKFIRNIYYLFWLAILPMAILLAVCAFQSLLKAIDDSRHKTAWLVYIVVCHLIFGLFLAGHKGVLWGAWAGTALSLVYFSVYVLKPKLSWRLGFAILLASMFIQSFQVYTCMGQKLDKAQKYVSLSDPNAVHKTEIYYASNWFARLVDVMDPNVVYKYRNSRWALYDDLAPYKENQVFFDRMQEDFQLDADQAYVPMDESKPEDWVQNPSAPSKADIDPEASGELSVVHADADSLVLRSRLDHNKFLVIYQNYSQDWHAWINGRPVRLFRANFAFQGLWVPAGESNITLRFLSPPYYIFHLAVMAVFAAAFLYLLFLCFREDWGAHA